MHVARPLTACLAPISAAIRAQRQGDPLAPVTVLVPDRAVGRWLVRSLAEMHGVAANLQIQLLPTWLASLAPRGPQAEAPLDAERLTVSLLGHLLHPRLAHDTPALLPVVRWLSRAKKGPDPEAAAELAGRLASRFLAYAECLPSPLDADTGGTTLAWQRALWALTFTADGRLRTDPPNHLAALLEPLDAAAPPERQLPLLGPAPRWRLMVPLLLDPSTAPRLRLPSTVLDLAPGPRPAGVEAVCAWLASLTRWVRIEAPEAEAPELKTSEIKKLLPTPLVATGRVAERGLGVEAVCAALAEGHVRAHRVAVYLADARRCGELESLAAAFEARGVPVRWPGRRAVAHAPAMAAARTLLDAIASPAEAPPHLHADLARLHAPRPWASWCADLDTLWHRWLPEGELNRSPRERLRSLLAGLALAAAEAPVTVPGGLSTDEGPVVPRASFLERVRTRLEALNLPRPPPELGEVGAEDGVQLALLGAGAAVPADAVWVFGLSADALLPRASVDGLDLRSEAQRALSEPGPAALLAALDAACAAARHHLWLSWPAVDEVGEVSPPADAVWTRLAAAGFDALPAPAPGPVAAGLEAAAVALRAELSGWLGGSAPTGARLWRGLEPETRARLVAPGGTATERPAPISLRALHAYLRSPVQGAARWRLAQAEVGDLELPLEARLDDAGTRPGRALDPPLVDTLRAAFWRGQSAADLVLPEASAWDRRRAQAARNLLTHWTEALARINAPAPPHWLDLSLSADEDATDDASITLSPLHLPNGDRVSLHGRLARLSPQRLAAVVCTEDTDITEAHLLPALLSLVALCASGAPPARFTAIVLPGPSASANAATGTTDSPAEALAQATVRTLPVPDTATALGWLSDLAHDLRTEPGDTRLPIEVVTRWYHERFGQGRSYARPFERRIERNADRQGPVRHAMELPLADAERMNRLDHRRFRPIFLHLLGGGT
jgi:hypothetical protein